MPDSRFFNGKPAQRLQTILAHIGGASEGLDPPLDQKLGDSLIRGLSHPRADDLSAQAIYINDQKRIADVDGKSFGLCLISKVVLSRAEPDEDVLAPLRGRGPILVRDDAKLDFIKLAHILYEERQFDDHQVHPSAAIAPDARIHPSVVIGPDAMIGAGVSLGPNTVIGPGVTIGSGTRVASNVTITHATLGADCSISAGVRIGEPGFGVHASISGLVTIPQLGAVQIGARVEIGANSTVDRGALGDTIIGDDTRIDNLVQIAHNVVIGKRCLIAAHTGLSGSCIFGDDVMCGGQVGLADHLTIGDGAQLVSQAGVMNNVPPGERWAGTPAKPMGQFMREVALVSRLVKTKKRK